MRCGGSCTTCGGQVHSRVICAGMHGTCPAWLSASMGVPSQAHGVAWPERSAAELHGCAGDAVLVYHIVLKAQGADSQAFTRPVEYQSAAAVIHRRAVSCVPGRGRLASCPPCWLLGRRDTLIARLPGRWSRRRRSVQSASQPCWRTRRCACDAARVDVPYDERHARLNRCALCRCRTN